MIGGAVAVLVEMVLLPVKARTRMVASLAAALRYVNEMENCIAAGVEEGRNFNIYNTDRVLRFEHASREANGALAAAETFCWSFLQPSCVTRFTDGSQYHFVAPSLGLRGPSRV